MFNIVKSKTAFATVFFCMMLVLSSCGIFVPKKQKVKLKNENKEIKVIVPSIDKEKPQKIGEPIKVDKLAGSFQVISTLPNHKANFYVIHANVVDKMGVWSSFVDFALAFPTAGLSLLVETPKSKYSSVNVIPSPEPLLMRDSLLNFINLDELSIKDLKKEPLVSYLEIKIKRKQDLSLEDSRNKKLDVDDEWDFNYQKTRIKEYYFIHSSYDLLKDSIRSILNQSNFIDTNKNLVIPTQAHLSLSITINQIQFIDYYLYSSHVYEPRIKQAQVDMTWYLRNRYDELLDSFNVIEYSGLMNYELINPAAKNTFPFNLLVSDAIQNGFTRLKYEKSFLEHLKREDRSKIGDVVLIKQSAKEITNLNDAKKATVTVKTSNGHGSGAVISSDGFILTNYHVISTGMSARNKEVMIKLEDGKELAAEIIKYNLDQDLALLKVNHSFEFSFKVNKQKKPSYFEQLYAIGSPRSIELQNSLTSGVFSAERMIDGRNLLQIGMAVNSGNSGGPLFDDNFKLRGIIVSKLIGRATEGVAFAIPMTKIDEYLKLEFK